MLHKRGKFPVFSYRWCLPYFDRSSCSYGKVTSIRGELEIVDFGFEVEVVKSCSANEVCEDSSTVFVDRQEECALWRERYSGDVLAVSEGEGEGLVAVTENFVSIGQEKRKRGKLTW